MRSKKYSGHSASGLSRNGRGWIIPWELSAIKHTQEVKNSQAKRKGKK